MDRRENDPKRARDGADEPDEPAAKQARVDAPEPAPVPVPAAALNPVAMTPTHVASLLPPALAEILKVHDPTTPILTYLQVSNLAEDRDDDCDAFELRCTLRVADANGGPDRESTLIVPTDHNYQFHDDPPALAWFDLDAFEKHMNPRSEDEDEAAQPGTVAWEYVLARAGGVGHEDRALMALVYWAFTMDGCLAPLKSLFSK